MHYKNTMKFNYTRITLTLASASFTELKALNYLLV